MKKGYIVQRNIDFYLAKKVMIVGFRLDASLFVLGFVIKMYFSCFRFCPASL